MPSMARRRGPLLDDAGSWGEMLQKYEAEKKAVPPPYHRPPIVTAQQKAAEQARYNPVLQTFNDRALETTARTMETEAVVAHLNRARDRQIASESTFDILTMRDKRGGLGKPASAQKVDRLHLPTNQELPTFRHPLDSACAYNIISGMSLAEHSYKPPDARPKVSDTLEVSKPRLQSVANLPRDYDILSGKYVHSHEEKIEKESQIDRRKAAQKFWETHDYNAFTCEFYDPSKEARQREVEAKSAVEQKMKAFKRMPPSYQKGEGNIYDITTHVVKNEALDEKRKADEQRLFDSKRDTWERDKKVHEQMRRQTELAEQRTLNRGSHQRYRDAYGNGYSIIDHRDYAREAPPPPRVAPPPTLWSTLKSNPGTRGSVRSGGFQRVNMPK